eukprot:TRINITY_DN34617_c0_g1_i1.p1 TRINITY_DN34617_c0_g1~~TRINITY_DN34617_c0_g1_i1.p1  ORF type:complete len:235 (+),score=47.67 TRINITY_DN34617_c0_g1_i1:58-705(+)
MSRRDDNRNRDRQGSRQRSHRDQDRDEKTARERDSEKWGKRVAVAREESSSDSESEPEKERTNFKTTGLLEEDEGETYKGRKLKWHMPDDMKESKRRWTLLTFKDNKPMEGKDAFLDLNRSPAYMFGRDTEIVDVPVLHPSISMQHSVVVFRLTKADEENRPTVKPYIIDLDSTNGTFINGRKADGGRYYRLYNKDVFKFGHSTREYMIMDSTDV